MAKPIKETPILYGRDAKNFINNTKDSNVKKVTTQEMERIKSAYEKLSAIAKF